MGRDSRRIAGVAGKGELNMSANHDEATVPVSAIQRLIDEEARKRSPGPAMISPALEPEDLHVDRPGPMPYVDPISAPRLFFEETLAYFASWLHDSYEYRLSSMDEEDLDERKRDVAEAMRFCDTAQAALDDAERDAISPEEFRGLVNEVATCFFGNPVPVTEESNDRETELSAVLNTALYAYPIFASWRKEGDHTYMGGFANRHGNGGRNIADGRATRATWFRMLRDIVAVEMMAYRPPEDEPRIAERKGEHSFTPDVKVAYGDNGALAVNLTGDFARRVAQQAQALGMTAEEYIRIKMEPGA